MASKLWHYNPLDYMCPASQVSHHSLEVIVATVFVFPNEFASLESLFLSPPPPSPHSWGLEEARFKAMFPFIPHLHNDSLYHWQDIEGRAPTCFGTQSSGALD